MHVEELETLLRKPAHTEEECARIVGSCISLAYNKMISTTSGLIDCRVPPGSLNTEPPLSALMYAAQGILFPALSFNHIPDLLDILSQVERVREFSLEHAKWALIWQRFYETRPNPNVRVLQKSDKDILKKVLKPERLDATRRIYVCIVEHIIRLVCTLSFFFASDLVLCLPALACASSVDPRRGIVSPTPLPPDLLSLGPRETQ
jgi:hypothetical protein